MLRLQAFGGLTLSRGSENLTGAVTQRRRLAILALLAVAGEAGMSRDKLLAYLWAESSAERARHVLNQLLYAQRRQVGDEALFLGRKTLRLNPSLIGSDVADFEQALEAGDPKGAVARYGGPFLDGFFLKDAPEFERWVDDQRVRYTRRAAAATTVLAERATVQGALADAAEWWRRGAELDPYNSRTAAALVRALAAAGDRGGALAAVRRHEAVLRDQLGVTPDAEFHESVRGLV